VKYISLELDPLLWSAYEELCDLGANVEPSVFFGETSYFSRSQASQSSPFKVQPSPSHHQQSHNEIQEKTNRRSNGTVLPEEDDNNSEVRIQESFATPEVLRSNIPLLTGMTTPREAVPTSTRVSTRIPASAFKTPSNNMTASGNNHAPGEVVKKPRVGGAAPSNFGFGSAPGAGGAKLRKTMRRTMNENDDKVRRNTRLSFSSVHEEETPVRDKNQTVKKRRTCILTEPIWLSTRLPQARELKKVARTLQPPRSHQSHSSCVIRLQRSPLRIYRQKTKRLLITDKLRVSGSMHSNLVAKNFFVC
jgi:hypothetical protein